MTGPCAVYRHYDAAGNLLYVGASVNPWARFVNHQSVSKWPRLAVRMEIEWHDSRREAFDAERKAIFNEKPVFNDSTPFKQRRKRAAKSDAPAASVLADWLNAEGVTQKQLAQEAGVHESLICRIMIGKGAPNKAVATAIEDMTGGAVPASLWPRLASPERDKSHDEDVRALNAEGLLDKEISDRLGIAYHTVTKIRAELGLPRNARKRRSKYEAQLRECVDAGMSCSEAARHMGIVAPQAFNLAKTFGLTFKKDGRKEYQGKLRQGAMGRVERVRNLAAEGKTVTEVARLLNLPQPTISKLKAKHGIVFKTTHPNQWTAKRDSRSPSTPAEGAVS